MGEDEFDIGATLERAVEQQARDRARGVERILHQRRIDPRQQVHAARRHGRMEEDRRLAPVQFVEDGRERGIARPLVLVVGLQLEPVGVQRARGMVDLLQTQIDMRQRQQREHAEAAGMSRHKPCRELVALARERMRALRLVRAHDHGRDRGDGGADAVPVHRLERHGGRPIRHHLEIHGVARHALALLGEPTRRDDVVVHVDAMHGFSPFPVAPPLLP